jgi:hypothetical protein
MTGRKDGQQLTTTTQKKGAEKVNAYKTKQHEIDPVIFVFDHIKFRESDIISTKSEVITPEDAKSYLSTSTGNMARMKPIIQSKVDFYARIMAAKKWYYTHQGIAFNTKGELGDGHNRLHAVIKSGVPIATLVHRNVPDEAFKGCDQGKNRTLSDITRIPKGLVEPCRFAARLAFDKFIPSPFEVERAYNSLWGECLRDLVDKMPTKTRYFGAAPMKTAAAYWANYDDRSYSYNQYAALIYGDYDSMSDLTKVLSRKVHMGELTTTNHDEAFAIGMMVFDEKFSKMKRIGKINTREMIARFRASSGFVSEQTSA